MSNIQQSVNSVLTTGAALKTFSEEKELKKSQAEKLDLEKQLLKEQIERIKNLKINEAYIDALKDPVKVPNTNDFKSLRPEKDLYKSDKSIRPEKYLYANTYNSNTEFDKGMKSAKDLYADTYNSLDSFMEEYNNRKSNGGIK